jgi:hypothetical protein
LYEGWGQGNTKRKDRGRGKAMRREVKKEVEKIK